MKWGKGSVVKIQTIYKSISITAENIDDINPIVILPDNIKRKVYYVRTIHTSETKRNYDYGSRSEFIEAEEIKLGLITCYQSYVSKLVTCTRFERVNVCVKGI